jgi:hypothetical protein
MSNKTHAPIASGSDPSARRPYHSPEFIVYGTIRQITESVNNVGGPDGGLVRGFTRTR